MHGFTSMPNASPGALRRNLKPILFAAALLAVVGGALWLPVSDWVLATLAWIEARQTSAWIVYVAAYIVATVLLIPGSILTLGAGFLFGLPAGVAVVSAGSVLGAASAFGVGRFLARDWVTRKSAGMPRFRALDRATRREGFVIVLLARLSPLFPFNLLNYAFAITSVRFWDYFLASWLGMLPVTVLYVYVGSLAKSLAEIASGAVQAGAAGVALFVVGLLATLALTVLITHKAARALGAHLDSDAREAKP
jgi:uncharacterized membrane protein YdjX (TVP38/TMEM64 family)